VKLSETLMPEKTVFEAYLCIYNDNFISTTGCHQLWPWGVLEVVDQVEGQHLQAGLAEPLAVFIVVLHALPHIQIWSQ